MTIFRNAAVKLAVPHHFERLSGQAWLLRRSIPLLCQALLQFFMHAIAQALAPGPPGFYRFLLDFRQRGADFAAQGALVKRDELAYLLMAEVLVVNGQDGLHELVRTSLALELHREIFPELVRHVRTGAAHGGDLGLNVLVEKVAQNAPRADQLHQFFRVLVLGAERPTRV